MTLHPQTRLQDLLETWPFLVDFLAGLSPDYRILRRPLLRRTLARGATLERVAVMGGRPVDRLLAEIAAEVRARTGEEVTVRGEAPQGGRADALKGIIRDLHRGASVEQVKGRFDELVSGSPPGRSSRWSSR